MKYLIRGKGLLNGQEALFQRKPCSRGSGTLFSREDAPTLPISGETKSKLRHLEICIASIFCLGLFLKYQATKGQWWMPWC